MTPAKIKEHEPTTVSSDPSDQTIIGQGQTGTDSQEAEEEYRRRGITKVGEFDTTSSQQQKGEQTASSIEDKASETVNTVEEGAKGTFDKLKAGAKALGKKVTDPDTSLEEEYNKEKTR